MMTITQAIQYLTDHNIPNPGRIVGGIVYARHGEPGGYTDQPLEALTPETLIAAIGADWPSPPRPPYTRRRTDPVYSRDEPHVFTIPLTKHQLISFRTLYELCGVLPIAELTRASVTFYRGPTEVAAHVRQIRTAAREEAGGYGHAHIYQRLRWIHKAVTRALPPSKNP
ncbi:hypothetical protein [Nocardia brasiliensis]|uniref:hypothetical protein n=1 Tax=Nocardia brasiliensis TaxID=37326 RepID=UPI002453AD23|nr:hypothetical protein [Nocardia brasiliensis]